MSTTSKQLGPDGLWDIYQLGPALERLTELYRSNGDHRRAKQYADRFVHLWNHADPELQPRVTAKQAF